jgi:hypothetical protein
MASLLVDVLHGFGERLGSGDGERKTLLTRQIAFEPLLSWAILKHQAARPQKMQAYL